MFLVLNKKVYYLIIFFILYATFIQIAWSQCTGSSCGNGIGSCSMASSTSTSCYSLDTMKSSSLPACCADKENKNKASNMSCYASESSPKNMSMANGCGASSSCGSSNDCGSGSCGATGINIKVKNNSCGASGGTNGCSSPTVNAKSSNGQCGSSGCGGTASSNVSGSCGGMSGCGSSGGSSSCGSAEVTFGQDPEVIKDKGCGGRSLAYIASQQGIKIDESEIVKMIHYDPEKGASMLDIVNAAKKLGLNASGYKMNITQLEKRDLPLIVYLPDHFTVLVSMDKSKSTLTFTDSSKKEINMTKADFLKKWQGYVLEIHKAPTVSLAQ